LYTPNSFKVDDPEVLRSFIAQHSFGTLVTFDGQAPHATHLPMMLSGPAAEGGLLVFHMARANPQWRHFESATEVLAIFTGPHSYVSPVWYAGSPNVPTWNYTAVHIYGRAKIVADQHRFAQLLSELVEFYEAPRENRWNYDIPADYREQMMKAIVGVELTITRVEGKFKLSQNRPEEIANVQAALASSRLTADREVAEMMRTLQSNPPNAEK
jgi:transcriptional regulator